MPAVKAPGWSCWEKSQQKNFWPLVEFLSISSGKETQVPNQSWNPSNFREQGSWVVARWWTFLLHNLLPDLSRALSGGWGQASKLSCLFDGSASQGSSDRYGLGYMFWQEKCLLLPLCDKRVCKSQVTGKRAETVNIYIGLMLCQKLY